MKNLPEIALLPIAACCLLLSLCSAPISSVPVERGLATSISSSQDKNDAVHAVQEWGEKDRTGLPVSGRESHSSGPQEAERKGRSRSQERTWRSSALLTHWGPSAKGFLPKSTGQAPKFLLTVVLIATAIFLSSRLGRPSLGEADGAPAGSEQASSSFPSQKIGLGLVSVALLLLTLGLAAAGPVRSSRGPPRKVKGVDPQMPVVTRKGDTIIIGEQWGDDKGEKTIRGSETSITFEFQKMKLVLHPTLKTEQQLPEERLRELNYHLTTYPPQVESKKVEWGKVPKRGDSYVAAGHDETPYDSWKEGQTEFEVYLPSAVRRALQGQKEQAARKCVTEGVVVRRRVLLSSEGEDKAVIT